MISGSCINDPVIIQITTCDMTWMLNQTWGWNMYNVRIRIRWGVRLVEPFHKIIVHARGDVNFVGRMIKIICSWRLSFIRSIYVVKESNLIFELEAPWKSMLALASVRFVTWFSIEEINFGIEWSPTLKISFTIIFALFLKKYVIKLRIFFCFLWGFLKTH